MTSIREQENSLIQEKTKQKFEIAKDSTLTKDVLSIFSGSQIVEIKERKNI